MLEISPDTLFQGFVGICGVLVTGWLTYQGRRSARHERENSARDKRHDDLEKEYRTFLAELPKTYVAKDDYRVDITDIKSMITALGNDVKEAIRGR